MIIRKSLIVTRQLCYLEAARDKVKDVVNPVNIHIPGENVECCFHVKGNSEAEKGQENPGTRHTF